jgi:hypothetical protein
MSNSWATSLQTKLNSEAYLSGSDTGTCTGCEVSSEVIAVTGDPLTGMVAVLTADLTAVYFATDYACAIVITLSTGSKTITLPAGGFFYWSTGSNITNPFGYNLVSAVVNFAGTAPTITGRIWHN